MTMSAEEVNRFCSKLIPGQIMKLPDEDILKMAVEKPDHPGQYGFMLSVDYFRSQQHLADTMTALLFRLGQIKDKPC